MTSYDVIEAFRREIGAHLTIMEGGEHWFHTPADNSLCKCGKKQTSDF